ncbi:MAG: VOC family protein [Bacteroidota bacterium]
MSQPIISGIQQIGIGIPKVYEAWKWYRQHFNMDVPIFDEAAEAALMLPYTGGQPRKRHAVLALNMQGGGGLEIWQYTERTPQAATFELQLGDLGIYIAKFKSRDVAITYREMKANDAELLGELSKLPNGQPHFFFRDPYGNIGEVVEGLSWFNSGEGSTGGAGGCTLGVSDVDQSIRFYKELLGYDTVVYDETNNFEDMAALPGGNHKVRRALLRHSRPRKGSFSQLLGASEIELVQVLDRSPKKIFENRLWGDLGYIHLCFDVKQMDQIKALCAEKGHPFQVDSGNFDMGEAAGRFAYIEDPDGTLIELVEAYKIPIMKKIGWYLNLRNRNPEKPLPRWMLKALKFGRVKD